METLRLIRLLRTCRCVVTIPAAPAAPHAAPQAATGRKSEERKQGIHAMGEALNGRLK